MTEVTVHYYLSGASAKALTAHVDEYDVFVFQLAGEKQWTYCVPVVTEETEGLNQAQPAQLWALHHDQGIPVDLTDTHTWQCQDITLQSGEWLYLPYGAAHAATTSEDHFSLHATVGLVRFGHAWRDLAMQRCEDRNLAESNYLGKFATRFCVFVAISNSQIFNHSRDFAALSPCS